MTEKVKRLTLIEVLARIVALWVVCDIGYHVLTPILGIGTDYSNHPFQIAAYYLVWVGITLIVFWDFYSRWNPFDARHSTFFVALAVVVGIISYFLFILPLFPAIQWSSSWKPPSELLSASQWYFLPKSIEIVLQQLLIVAMVLSFKAQKFSLKMISRWSAALFGSMHLLLVFGGATLAYVSVFTLSATAAGFIFPHLMLRVRNGFIYSYALHWAFYAVVVVLTRALFAV